MCDYGKNGICDGIFDELSHIIPTFLPHTENNDRLDKLMMMQLVVFVAVDVVECMIPWCFYKQKQNK